MEDSKGNNRDNRPSFLGDLVQNMLGDMPNSSASLKPEEVEDKTQNRHRVAKNTKLALSSAEIYMNRATIKDAEYVHSVLCQVGLPRKQIFLLDETGKKISDEHGKYLEAREFERKSGNASLLVKAGECWNGYQWIKQPLPYGIIPRLTLVYIGSEAIRTQEPVINIGETLTDFMLSLGMAKSGGKNGRYRYIKEQIKSLAVCELKLGVANSTEALSVNVNPITEFRAWLSNTEDQKTLWPGEITLSDKFFDSLMLHSVPLDSRALRELGDSALALDIYFWLAHRLHRTKIDGELIKWGALKSQFGQEYKTVFHFKEEFTFKLKQALSQYANAKVKIDPAQGIIIYESPSPVPKKDYYPIKTKKRKNILILRQLSTHNRR